MKSWKTSAFGIASVLIFIVGHFWPQYKEFANGLVAVLIAGGFLVSKDANVTGGTTSQPTVSNPPSIIES